MNKVIPERLQPGRGGRIGPTLSCAISEDSKRARSGSGRRRRRFVANDRITPLPNRLFTGARSTRADAGSVSPSAEGSFSAQRSGGPGRPARHGFHAVHGSRYRKARVAFLASGAGRRQPASPRRIVISRMELAGSSLGGPALRFAGPARLLRCLGAATCRPSSDRRRGRSRRARSTRRRGPPASSTSPWSLVRARPTC
jgi:hypothetical protein